jgi:hypothetical protein
LSEGTIPPKSHLTAHFIQKGGRKCKRERGEPCDNKKVKKKVSQHTCHQRRPKSNNECRVIVSIDRKIITSCMRHK